MYNEIKGTDILASIFAIVSIVIVFGITVYVILR